MVGEDPIFINEIDFISSLLVKSPLLKIPTDLEPKKINPLLDNSGRINLFNALFTIHR